MVAEFARKRAETGWLQRYLREMGKVDFGAQDGGNGASVTWLLPKEARGFQREARFRTEEDENYL